MSKLTEEDVSNLYNRVSEQMNEDRDAVNDLYEELREYLRDHPLRYVDLGEILARLADLKIKQTHQVVEVFKVVHKAAPSTDFGGLSAGDLDYIDKKLHPKDDAE